MHINTVVQQPCSISSLTYGSPACPQRSKVLVNWSHVFLLTPRITSGGESARKHTKVRKLTGKPTQCCTYYWVRLENLIRWENKGAAVGPRLNKQRAEVNYPPRSFVEIHVGQSAPRSDFKPPKRRLGWKTENTRVALVFSSVLFGSA